MRQRIHGPHQLRRQMHDCLPALLSVLRVAIPALLLLLFWRKAQGIYIQPLHLEIPASTMWVLCGVCHAVSIFYGRSARGRMGLGYELCCCVMATELWLFLYYLQYQPLGATLLLGIYAFGWAALERQGRGWQRLLNDGGRRHAARSSDPSSPAAFLALAKRRYAVMAAAGLLLVPSILTVSYYGLEGVQHRGKVHAPVSVAGENQMLANLSTIQLLNDASWREMGIQEKLDTLQVVADIETRYLQIEPVSVVSVHLENHTLGSYDNESRTVKIDFDHHAENDAMECLNTLLHECRHAFQHDCVQSLDWSNEQVLTGSYYAQARLWRQNFASYTPSSHDYAGYQQQAIEMDARAYADEVEDIYQYYCYLSKLPVR